METTGDLIQPMHNIHFEKTTLSHKDIIFEWLEKPHVREFWDNSQTHRDDILSFINTGNESSNYKGIFTYWMGSVEEEFYSLLMTSEVTSEDNLPEVWRDHLSKTGKTFSIDFMIGNEKFLGKGLATPTLEAFTGFIQEKIDKAVDLFMIDPAETNPKAKHVYAKAGFDTVAEFVRNDGFFKDINHFLMIKRLK
jgi:RimJ/RimL family protein N-acetyltransferase